MHFKGLLLHKYCTVSIYAMNAEAGATNAANDAAAELYRNATSQAAMTKQSPNGRGDGAFVIIEDEPLTIYDNDNVQNEIIDRHGVDSALGGAAGNSGGDFLEATSTPNRKTIDDFVEFL